MSLLDDRDLSFAALSEIQPDPSFPLPGELPEEAVALAILYSDEPYPIDFDQAWRWLGYSSRGTALDALWRSRLKLGRDYDRPAPAPGARRRRGRPRYEIRLSIGGLKRWGMLAGTAMGERIRDYFIETERRFRTSGRREDDDPTMEH